MLQLCYITTFARDIQEWLHGWSGVSTGHRYSGNQKDSFKCKRLRRKESGSHITGIGKGAGSMTAKEYLRQLKSLDNMIKAKFLEKE